MEPSTVLAKAKTPGCDKATLTVTFLNGRTTQKCLCPLSTPADKWNGVCAAAADKPTGSEAVDGVYVCAAATPYLTWATTGAYTCTDKSSAIVKFTYRGETIYADTNCPILSDNILSSSEAFDDLELNTVEPTCEAITSGQYIALATGVPATPGTGIKDCDSANGLSLAEKGSTSICYCNNNTHTT